MKTVVILAFRIKHIHVTPIRVACMPLAGWQQLEWTQCCMGGESSFIVVSMQNRVHSCIILY